MTGDFISFSPFYPMKIQIASGFDPTGQRELKFRFWPSVGETILNGVLFRLLLESPFTGHAEIDDVSHARFELSRNA
jgi:hypothetical protein